jgi:hypothetical protein
MKTIGFKRIVQCAALLVIASTSVPAAANAQLLGQSMTCRLQLLGNAGFNYFDPSNGTVPAGFLNSAGTTVTISNPQRECGFGFTGPNTELAADFSASGFTLSYLSDASANLDFNLIFTSLAFNGMTLTKISDNFPDPFSFSLSGNTVQVVSNLALLPASTTYTAQFSLTTVPEPSSVVLFGGGLLGLAALGRRKQRNESR